MSQDRFIGGFFVGPSDTYNAHHRGRPVRYIIVLDSYADAVAWRREMGADVYIAPLSQAAGPAADRLRTALAWADDAAAKPPEPEPPPAPEPEPPAEQDQALVHLRALVKRPPSNTHYDTAGTPVERCYYCESDLAGRRHTGGCAWQAARKFILEKELGL